MSGSPVLVTGASGYVATHVVQQLLKAGHKVRGTVRSLKNETKVKPLYELWPAANANLELVEADLLKADGWEKAASGCEYVMHVASPFPDKEPEHEDMLIKPAVDGTLNVLKACHAVQVKRVILTSSVAAIFGDFGAGGGTGKTYTEADWTEITSSTGAYIKSKTLAEKAAWDYVNSLPKEGGLELVTINPSIIFGPLLCGSYGTSVIMMKYLLERKMPMLPKMLAAFVDVRDVAAAHVSAMQTEAAVGKRFMLHSHSLWMKDVAQIVHDEFRPLGYSIPLTQAPSFAVRFLSVFDKSLRLVTPSLGVVYELDNTAAKNMLGFKPITAHETIIDTCHSMIKSGFVTRKSGYKEPPVDEPL